MAHLGRHDAWPDRRAATVSSSVRRRRSTSGLGDLLAGREPVPEITLPTHLHVRASTGPVGDAQGTRPHSGRRPVGETVREPREELR